MAYQKVNWQPGTKVSDPYVEVDGKRGTYTPAVYSGSTPCNPTSLNIMDEGIFNNSQDIEQNTQDIQENRNILNGLASAGCLYVEDIQCRNLFNKNNITEGVCLNGDGTTREASNFCISDYIPVKMLKKYTYQGLTNVGNETYSEFYSSNKTFISSFQQQTAINTITIPIGAAYVRFSIRTSSSDQDTFQIEPGEKASNYTEYKNITPIIENNLDSDSNVNVPSVHAVNSLKPFVMWENEDVSVSFSAQDITLNSEDYNFYEIYYIFSTSPQNLTTFQCSKSIKECGTLLNSIGASTGASARRRVNFINNTTLHFEDSYYGSNNEVANNYIIPVKVIGYRL